MTAPRIALVVEGYGDRDAVPTVVRRYLHSVEEWEIMPSKPLNAKGRGNSHEEWPTREVRSAGSS